MNKNNTQPQFIVYALMGHDLAVDEPPIIDSHQNWMLAFVLWLFPYQSTS